MTEDRSLEVRMVRSPLGGYISALILEDGQPTEMVGGFLSDLDDRWDDLVMLVSQMRANPPRS